VLVAPDGRVWTGTAEGAIHVHDPRDGSTTTVTATGGRPLGLENLPDGRILVCDAHRGLLALDPATGELETLLTEVDGDRLLFTNNAALAPAGSPWVRTAHPGRRRRGSPTLPVTRTTSPSAAMVWCG
jgi:sugar lactone lactonase YvrE